MDMAKSGLPKSVRKYLRRQKALIRRTATDPQSAEQKIKELMEGFKKKN